MGGGWCSHVCIRLWRFLPGSPFVNLPTCVPISANAFLCLYLREPLFESCVRAVICDPLWGPAPRLRRCSGLHRPQTEAEVLEQSAQTLRAHLGELLSALCRSIRACPAVVRATFRQLFQRVRERFPSAEHEVHLLQAGLGEGRKRWGKGSCGTPGYQ